MHLWQVRNSFVYSLTMGFVIISIIYFTKVMEVNDKTVMKAMIDIDLTIANLNLTEKQFN